MKRKVQIVISVFVLGILLAGVKCEFTHAVKYWYDSYGEMYELGQMDSMLLEVPWDVEGLGCDKAEMEEYVFEEGKQLGYGAYSEKAIRTVLKKGYFDDYVIYWKKIGTLPSDFSYTQKSIRNKECTSTKNKKRASLTIVTKTQKISRSDVKKQAVSFKIKTKADTKVKYKVVPVMIYESEEDSYDENGGSDSNGKFPTYSSKNSKKYISVSTTGKVTLKKGAHRGIYLIRLQAQGGKKYYYKSRYKYLTIIVE